MTKHDAKEESAKEPKQTRREHKNKPRRTTMSTPDEN